MRFLLQLLTLLILNTPLIAQKLFNKGDLTTIERFQKLGMPFSTFVTNQKLFEHDTVLINLTPSHVFSCFGVGWGASDKSLEPSLFKVSYRTLEPSGIWSEWIEMEGEIPPAETPTEKYWTEAIFTHNAESHLELELKLTGPVTTTALQIDLFDGNYKSDETFNKRDSPQSSSNEKGARNCPQFPTMITRAEWCGGSANCNQVLTPYNPIYTSPTHVVIHHGASPNTYTDGQAVVRSYYNYHVNTLGWSDIGYNYIIDKHGNFFQGRHNPNLPTTDVRGAHAGAANSASIGINYPGNLDIELATPIQMQRVSELLAWWFNHKALSPLSSASMQTQYYGIQVQPRITGHRDIGNTVCPGNDLHSRLSDLRNMTYQIIDDCNTVITDIDAPETAVQSTYDWRGHDFWAEFNDSDNPGGSGVDEQYYQVLDFDGTEWRANNQNGFFNDNFNTTIHPEWVTQSGSWSINSGNLYQNNEAVGNTNIFAPLTQNNQESYLYQWSGIIAGTGTNRRSGLHFFADNPTLPNRGNSYLAWFRADDNAFHLYKIVNDVLNLVVNEPYTINTNTLYDFKVSFNPQTGAIEAFINDNRVASYTDASPFSEGGFISFRNGDSEAYFDDFKVRTSRSFQEKISVGPSSNKDARFESPITTQDACRVNSIVKDVAGNWSVQNTRQIYVDWSLPSTSSATVAPWQTEDFTVDFTDEDNVAGSGIARRFYQVIDFDGADWRANAERGFFSDNFDQTTGIHPEWTVVNGSWNNTNGYLEQTDEALGNTNIYAFLKQDLSNRYLYNFQLKLNGVGTNKRGGFHYFCDDPSSSNRGNSYFIWFRQDFQTVEFYKVTNDTLSQEKVYPLTFPQNLWMDVKIVYDRITGETLVYVNDQLVADWQDENPFQTGDYISFRSGNGNMSVNNLKIYRTRSSQSTVTLGTPTADVRYENPDPTTFSAKVKSIVHDEAHNLSEIYYHDLNVDWTPPTNLNTILDGLATDIDTFYTANEISANWDDAIDVNSGISYYLMSVGTSLGATDVVAWTTVGNVTSYTLTGLSLFGGVTYYINIKAVNGANLESSVVSSDGQYLAVDASLDENEQVPFNLFPNPIKDEVQLQVSGTIKEFDATLYAMNGQVVWKQNSIQNTSGLITLPIQSSIAAGMYVFELRSGEHTWEAKVVKE